MTDNESKKHNKEIIKQFSKQAAPFESKMRKEVDSVKIVEKMSGLRASDRVLDVACGPGVLSCEIARHAGHVIGIDITFAMIERAKLLQKEGNLANLAWGIGDVSRLPFRDGCFSLVITRFSLHHFLDPSSVLGELFRVCEPGGRAAVADVALPADRVDAFNSVEKLRDPSHVRALTVKEIEERLAASGLVNLRRGSYELPMELEKQLSASFPNQGDDEKIRQLFRNDIGADELGVGAHLEDGKIRFSYPVTIVVADRPTA